MREEIFLDTNPLLVFLTKSDIRYKKIGDILANNKLSLYTNFLVLNELRYKLLWLEAAEILKSTKKYEIIEFIKKDKKINYEINKKYMEFYLNIRSRIKILNFNDEIEIKSCEIASKYGLLPTDAMIIATMKINNIKNILTDDKDFRKVEGINVIQI